MISYFYLCSTLPVKIIARSLSRLTRRVDRMEGGIYSIASKIDAVLTRLSAMDRGSAMRRAVRNKMLNSVMADDNGEIHSRIS